MPGAGNPQAFNRYAYSLSNPVRYRDPSGHYTQDELLQLHVFNGPNQMQQMKEDDYGDAFWYWLLRAADSGDRLSLYVGEWTGFTNGSMSLMEGQFETRSDSLMFVTSGGAEYRVRWYGFEDPSDPNNHGFNALSPEALIKPDGTVLGDLYTVRRYVQRRDGGNSVIDYWSLGASAYVGVGGGFALKADRGGRVYLTINLGVGLGGKGGWISMGNFATDYVADEHELEGYMTGASVSGAGSFVTGFQGTLPAEGPPAVEVGSGSVGASLSVDLTLKIWDFGN